MGFHSPSAGERDATRTGDGASARADVESALRRSEEGFRALLEQLPDIVAVHRDGRFVYANAAAVRFFRGEGPEDVVGTDVASIVHPDDRPKAAERMRAVLTQGGVAPWQEERLLRRDGTVAVAEVIAIGVHFDGHPAVLAVARDVTERRRVDAQLAQADRLASVGVVAAGVAHEINNPLTYVQLNLDEIVRTLPAAVAHLAQLGDAPAAARLREVLSSLGETAASAAEGARRVQAIVRDLRTFSRSDSDERTGVDPRAIVESAINLASNELRFRARVERALEPVPEVTANAGRLTQVVLNLLVNAAHAVGEGDPHTSVVRVRTFARGGHVHVSVEDNGPGMTPEVRARIFEPFFTTKPVGMGSGLGLAIAHNIVSALGGRIELTTAPGEGACFDLVLPARDAAAASHPAPRPAAPPSSRAKVPVGRVLVVDDEPRIREALAMLLRFDFEVTTDESAEAARTRVERGERFDAMLCDLMMPEVSGMELHDWLVARDPELASRMVFMTGGAFTERARRFLDAVPNPRVDKPMDPDELVAILRRVVSGEP